MLGGNPGAAAQHGPALWLRGDQRRGAEPRSALAPQLDAPNARGAAQSSRVRARHVALPLSEEPQGPRLFARISRRNAPVRRQCGPQLASGGTRPERIRWPRADRTQRRFAIPADRPANLPAPAAALRLLLVHARARSAPFE